MRTCINCNSKTTYIYKSKNRPNPYEQWHSYKNGYLCSRCYNRLITHPKWNKISHYREKIRKLRWVPSGKFLNLKEPIRKGICEWCGAVKGITCKTTHIHHFAEYHPEDPLKDTVELCASCHGKESMRIRLDQR